MVRLAGLEPATHGLGIIGAAVSACICLIYKGHKISIHHRERYKTIPNDTSIAKDKAKDTIKYPI
jgi:hypothetical protein